MSSSLSRKPETLYVPGRSTTRLTKLPAVLAASVGTEDLSPRELCGGRMGRLAAKCRHSRWMNDGYPGRRSYADHYQRLIRVILTSACDARARGARRRHR